MLSRLFVGDVRLWQIAGSEAEEDAVEMVDRRGEEQRQIRQRAFCMQMVIIFPLGQAILPIALSARPKPLEKRLRPIDRLAAIAADHTAVSANDHLEPARHLQQPTLARWRRNLADVARIDVAPQWMRRNSGDGRRASSWRSVAGISTSARRDPCTVSPSAWKAITST
jgi:hypothetical protein